MKFFKLCFFRTIEWNVSPTKIDITDNVRLIVSFQIGPFEFAGNLTGAQYANFISIHLRRMCRRAGIGAEEMGRVIFQHDGAPAHTSRIAQESVSAIFGNRYLGRGGMRDWPARSPDLNPLDFFFWGHIKSHVYREPIQDRADLERRFEGAVVTVTPEMLGRCAQSLLRRARCCVEVNGGHFEHLL